MKLARYTKQPGEKESYTIDYSDDLTDGDEVISATVVVTPTGLVHSATDQRADSVRVWLSGGASGTKYKVEVTATTGDGRVLQDEFTVTVKEY